ncbi:MAG TPA: hypothetical protein VFN56_01120 [Candidatus Saccharimonadales bacterium]|nr:hypothetical protein [Candidatus Saccharimonadales bacterium]
MNTLLPKVDKPYTGYAVAYYFLILVTLVDTVRSLIHMLAGDGGAGSIAGIDVGVAGGSNIVAMFGQWGGSQLLMAIFDWVVILRYRFLTTLALGLLTLEQCFRYLEGHLKPITSTHTPPGAIGTKLLFPILLINFILSVLTPKLARRKKPTPGA